MKVAVDAGNGMGMIAVYQPGIQNGAPDGIALVDNTNNPSCHLKHCFFNAIGKNEQKHLQLESTMSDSVDMCRKSLFNHTEC